MDNGLPDHKQEGYAERMYEQADLLRKSARETAVLDQLTMDALRARFKDDAILEGRRLNREAYIDGKREAEAMDRNREP